MKDKFVHIRTLLHVISLFSTLPFYTREMLNFDPQSVLVSYLRILLTEWEDAHIYQERAAAVIRQIQNRDVVHQMLVNLLINRVSLSLSFSLSLSLSLSLLLSPSLSLSVTQLFYFTDQTV